MESQAVSRPQPSNAPRCRSLKPLSNAQRFQTQRSSTATQREDGVNHETVRSSLGDLGALARAASLFMVKVLAWGARGVRRNGRPGRSARNVKIRLCLLFIPCEQFDVVADRTDSIQLERGVDKLIHSPFAHDVGSVGPELVDELGVS